MTGRTRAVLPPILATLFILSGLAAPRLVSSPGARLDVWTVGLVLVGAPIVLRTAWGMVRGIFAADLVASLALITAVIFRQPLAGLVVALMQTGGEALERYAAQRASQAVRELEALAPRIAHRQDDGVITDVSVDAIAVGDRLLVRPGEMVPCDGTVVEGRSGVDASRLTGEPVPLAVEPGTELQSGAINLESPLVLRATARAGESLYARVVELVRSAQASKAPVQRLADRYAVWFTPLTLAVCVAAWVLSGDPVRILSVLVIATPCPLILAVPVAIIGGINRAARHRIIVRQGGALEQLATVDTAVFDKTGTLTIGHPEVAAIRPVPPLSELELLRLTGALEQGSGHTLARSLTDAAHARVGILPGATEVLEAPGRGVSGVVDGHRVVVGALSLVREQHPEAAEALAALQDGAALRAYVAVDGRAAGTVTYADRVREGGREVTGALQRLGIQRLLLLSGDRLANARAIAAEVGIGEVAGDLLPQDKVAFVERLRREGHRILMVGDGINDAPALSRANVGLALAAHGGGITAEAADIVLLADDLALIPEAIAIARRSLRIARQSAAVGLGLSGLGMLAAALGFIPPTAGALLQEGIDVAVILNALRAVTGGEEEHRVERRVA